MSWRAFGSGVGIELAENHLRVAITRVRPGGIDVTGIHTIENYHQRPAAEWGNEFVSFLKQHNAAHLAATVLLPRREMIVRVINLPGVEPKDLEAALHLQIDTLHPYPEGEAAWTWARLNKSHTVLVGIAKASYIGRLVELFAEAGVKVAAFTFSAAAIHGALRLYGAPPSEGFLGLMETPGGVEAYGESTSKPIYSAIYDQQWERASVLASAELRLPENSAPARELAGLLPSPRRVPADARPAQYALAYLAAINSACPRWMLSVNLLPAAERSTSSRLIYVPSVILGGLLILAFAGLGFYHRYEDKKYLDAIEAEIRFLEPRAKRVSQYDQRTLQSQNRIVLMDRFQSRTRQDLDALREATKLIPPPAWLNTLELTRSTLVVAGETDQANGLLRALDSSPQFQNSEFLVPLSRVGNAEIFRIRSAREGAPQ